MHCAGTLTCNKMEFHKCSVGGVIYGDDEDEQLTDRNEAKTRRANACFSSCSFVLACPCSAIWRDTDWHVPASKGGAGGVKPQEVVVKEKENAAADESRQAPQPNGSPKSAGGGVKINVRQQPHHAAASMPKQKTPVRLIERS